MLAQELQQQLGIDWIILATAGVKGFAVIRQRLGRNGIKPEKFVGHQGIKQRAARLFQGDGDGAVGETAAQLGDPGLQGLRFLLYHQVLDLRGAGRLQADIVFLIRPVQADPGDDGVGQRSGMIHGKSSGKRWENTRARNLHSPYSKVLTGRHLSMRCRSERPAPLEALRVIVEQSGTPIRSGAGRVLRHPSYLFPTKFSSPKKRASICAKDSAPTALNPNTYKGRLQWSGSRKQQLIAFALMI